MNLLAVYRTGFMQELMGMTKVTSAWLTPMGILIPFQANMPIRPTGHQQRKSVMAMVIRRLAMLMFCCLRKSLPLKIVFDLEQKLRWMKLNILPVLQE